MPRILEAIAAAAIETGAPVMVHTNAIAQTGLPALQALTDAGVDPTRIVIAHAGDSNDLEYLREIADSGAALGFDRFNVPFFNPDEQRIETLVALLAEGYSDRIHLGHDAACFYDFMFGDPNFAEREAGLPPHLEDHPARPARGRRHARADRGDDDDQRASLFRARTELSTAASSRGRVHGARS